MSFFRQTPQPPLYTGLQISTSSATMPIPIAYGSPIVAANMIVGMNFGHVGGGSSKKLGAAKGGAGSVAYYIDAVLAFGEWPASEPSGSAPTIRINGTFNPGASLPSGFIGVKGRPGTFDFMNNAVGGPPFGFPEGSPGSSARNYPGVVCVSSTTLSAGANASIPQVELPLYRKFSGTCPLFNDATFGYEDADPALCIVDALTHPRYGAGFPASLLFGAAVGDSNNGLQGSLYSGANALVAAIGDSAVSTYCQAALSVGFSAVLRQAEPASGVIDRWCKLLVIAPVWTGTVLKFIPYWDAYSGANNGWGGANDAFTGNPVYRGLVYFRPVTTPVIDLTDDLIVQTKPDQDPVTLQRIDPADVYNRVRVTFVDRQNEYNTNIAEATDENDMETADLYGSATAPFNRIQDIQAGEEFTLVQYAQSSAQTIVTRNVSIRNTGKVTVGWDLAYLEPMDAITITDANLGLSRWPARVTSITEKDDYTLELEFEEFPIGAASPALYSSSFAGQTNTMPSTSTAPPNTNAAIFEPTPEMVAASTLWIAANGAVAGVASTNWGGCQVWMSSDGGTTYNQIGQINGPTTMGALTGNLPAFAGLNPDTGNTLAVSVAASGVTLASASSANAMAGIPPSGILDAGGGFEFLSFQTATLVSGFSYNLTTLYRGLFGSNAGNAHASAATFAVFDGSHFSWAVPSNLVGTQLWFKFLSFNSYGNALQALGSVTAIAYTPGALYVEDVSANSTHTLSQQPSFVGAVVNWRSSSAAAKSEQIPGAVNMTAGFPLTIVDSQGTAGDYPITITPASGTIGGQPTAVVSSPYGTVRLRADPNNADWVLAS